MEYTVETAVGIFILLASILFFLHYNTTLHSLAAPRMNVVPKAYLRLHQRGKLFVSQGSVVTMAATAIVNAANTGGLGGGGVDGAISDAEGLVYAKLERRCLCWTRDVPAFTWATPN